MYIYVGYCSCKQFVNTICTFTVRHVIIYFRKIQINFRAFQFLARLFKGKYKRHSKVGTCDGSQDDGYRMSIKQRERTANCIILIILF